MATIPEGVHDYWLSYQVRRNDPEFLKFRFRLDDKNVWACDEIVSDPDDPPTILGCDNKSGRMRVRCSILPVDKAGVRQFWLFGS